MCSRLIPLAALVRFGRHQHCSGPAFADARVLDTTPYPISSHAVPPSRECCGPIKLLRIRLSTPNDCRRHHPPRAHACATQYTHPCRSASTLLDPHTRASTLNRLSDMYGCPLKGTVHREAQQESRRALKHPACDCSHPVCTSSQTLLYSKHDVSRTAVATLLLSPASPLIKHYACRGPAGRLLPTWRRRVGGARAEAAAAALPAGQPCERHQSNPPQPHVLCWPLLVSSGPRPNRGAAAITHEALQ